MYDRPYDYLKPFQYNTYYGNSYIQPPKWSYPHPQYQSQDPMFYKTPFEQFAKPAQPNDWYAFMQQGQNPYPPKQSGLLSYFQDKNGQVDLDKMFSTVGQFANTVQQLSPVVKQFGSIMKNIK